LTTVPHENRLTRLQDIDKGVPTNDRSGIEK
jgi:hypothetical protein